MNSKHILPMTMAMPTKRRIEIKTTRVTEVSERVREIATCHAPLGSWRATEDYKAGVVTVAFLSETVARIVCAAVEDEIYLRHLLVMLNGKPDYTQYYERRPMEAEARYDAHKNPMLLDPEYARRIRLKKALNERGAD